MDIISLAYSALDLVKPKQAAEDRAEHDLPIREPITGAIAVPTV
jgi:hypothetical protein